MEKEEREPPPQWVRTALCFVGALLTGTLFGNEARWLLQQHVGTLDADVAIKVGDNARTIRAGDYYTETSCAEMFQMTSDTDIGLGCVPANGNASRFTPEHGGDCNGYHIVHGGCYAPETGRFGDPLCRECNRLRLAARFWATASDVRSRGGSRLHPNHSVINVTRRPPPPLPPLSATKPAHPGMCTAAALKELGQGAYHILEPGWPVDDLVWVPGSGCDMQPLSVAAVRPLPLPPPPPPPARPAHRAPFSVNMSQSSLAFTPTSVSPPVSAHMASELRA